MKKLSTIFLAGLMLGLSSLAMSADSSQYKLYEAICNDSEQEIQAAIIEGADINEYLEGVNAYPLKFAVVRGKEKAVEILLSKEAIIPYDESGDLVFQYQTLAYTASKLPNPKVYLLLLKKMMTYGDNWIPWCQSVYVEYIKNLINKRKVEPAIRALREGKDLLKDYVPNYQDIKVATVCNKVDSDPKWHQIIMEDVFTLLDPHSEKQAMSMPKFLELLQALIHFGYNVNKVWTVADPYCWLYNNESLLELVLKSGASASRKITFLEPTVKHVYRKSYPIFEAIYAGNLKSVKMLINRHASVNQVLDDNDYYSLRGLSRDRFMEPKTPFCYARDLNRDDVVELLVSCGAEV
ncbi:MAG: hypothetical protein WC747_04825 [Candidatus Babeliales bacterium]